MLKDYTYYAKMKQLKQQKMKQQCSQISVMSSTYSIPQWAWHKPLQEFLHPEYLLLKLPFQAVAVYAAGSSSVTCGCMTLTHLSCAGADSAHTNSMQRVQEQKKIHKIKNNPAFEGCNFGREFAD